MIRYEKDNHVGTIAIDAPCTRMEDLEKLAHELSDLRNRLGIHDEVRVLVLSGFTMIKWPMGPQPPEKIRTDCLVSMTGIPQPAARMAAMDRPTIAAIDGNALGPGLELALACDMRVAAETSCFGLPLVPGGVIPGDGGTQRLPRLVGRAKALEMILTGCTIDGKEALRIGLVNRVAAGETPMEAAMKIAHEMASKGPIALRYAKETVNKGMDLTLEQGLRLEADLYLLIHTTGDRTEGIKAFQEKRKAEFHGK